MLEFSESIIEKLSVHQIGNKTREENLYISKEPINLEDERLVALLKQFFLNPFKEPLFYNFTFSNDDFELNPIYRFAKDVFEHSDGFHLNTIHIAKHLYEVSNHQNIKSGDLFVVQFSNVYLDGQFQEALGIFKSENKHSFLQVDTRKETAELNYEDGINIEKMDKACLIFNADEEEGFRLCALDKSNKSTDAHYWMDLFLQVKECSDAYYQTKGFLSITKDFVCDKMGEEFEMNRADEIDYLNKSFEYFKKNESFNKEEFEQEVFNDANLIHSFRKFDQEYREDNDFELPDAFEISGSAVKKQQRVYKSVLKLDKNFHIYIHGDRRLIEQGSDENGTFYKIYYQEEY